MTDCTNWCESCGHDHHAVEVILTDLIVELRSGDWETFVAGDGERSIRMKDAGWVEAAAERAEARLREARDD